MKFIYLLSISVFVFFIGSITSQSITVPTTLCNPILLDGQMSDEEWVDAKTISINDNIKMLIKEMNKNIFIGFKFRDHIPRVVDLFIEIPGEPIYQLHSSMQIGERILQDTSWTNESPAWRWGNHIDWIASESKIDPLLSRDLPFEQRLYPSDGVEFQIRRTRFEGGEWQMRVEISSFVDTENVITYPPKSERKIASSWVTVKFD